MQYFKHFSSSEFLPNCSPSEYQNCLQSGFFDNVLFLIGLLDDFRDFLGYPIKITSSFRDFEHNSRVGGSKFSDHLSGSAVDFQCPYIPFDTFYLQFKDWLHDSGNASVFGQVIIYHKRKFIHAALATKQHPILTFYHYEQRNS